LKSLSSPCFEIQRYFQNTIFFATEDFNSSRPRDFILPLYAKVQAQTFDAHVSPPRVRNPLLNDLVVITFIDDEA
jgi:hypothetical protein